MRAPSAVSIDDAGEVVEERMVVVERARVLGQRVEGDAERAERLAVHRVGVRCCDTSGRAACTCEWMANAATLTGQSPSTTAAVVVDADQVRRADLLEAHAERVDPEAVGVLRVARGDVARDPLVEAEAAEQPERRRQALLEVLSLAQRRRRTRGR